MKLKASLLMAGIAASLVAPLAQAADGTITFNGTITASACTTVVGIVGLNAGSTSGKNATIKLPELPTSALTTAGTYAGQTGFDISLQGCQATATLNNVRTLFTTGNTPADDNYVMANTAASGAENVGVAILTTSGTQIDLNGGVNQDPGAPLPLLTGSQDDVTLHYQAAYKVLTGGNVTAGPVTGVADYTISYY